MDFIPVRLFFKKTGRLKYISHLDTMAVFTRAVSRCNLPVWYTQGFNPVIYISFPLPLSLGYEGLRESFDLRLTQTVDYIQLKDSLNSTLPAEMSIIEAGAPVDDPKNIAWADYLLQLYSKSDLGKLKDDFESFVSRPEIIVDKKSKKGTIKFDCAPYFKLNSIEKAEGKLVVRATIATGGSINVNPRIIVDGFLTKENTAIENLLVTRGNIYNNEVKIYR